MATLGHDVTRALRSFRNSPGFAFTAIVTVALGIGATTAIFSVVNAVLLRPLPYADADRLVLVQSDLMTRNVNDFPFPPGDLPDLRRSVTTLEDVSAVVTAQQTYTNDAGEPEIVTVAGVTPNFFGTLGARVVRGRAFVEADGTAPTPPAQVAGQPAGPPPAPLTTMAILSDGLWRSRFGADTGIVGKRFTMGQQTVEVVGVLEPGFELLWPNTSSVARVPDLYAALRIDLDNASRNNVFLHVVARLGPNATIAQAQSQVDGLVRDLRQQFPVKESAGLRWRVEPMKQYVVADVRGGLFALLGAVAFVLLIACANVANLLLVRASQRERDLAVRAALGGTRGALIRQMMVESLALAGAGAVGGLALAWAGTRVLLRIAPQTLPRIEHVNIDPVVFGFALGAAIVSAVVFGIVPALRASRVDLADALRAAGRMGALAGSGKWFRNGVVVAEVALAFVLLVGSGLMVRSFITLQRSDAGFTAGSALTFTVPALGRPEASARRAAMAEIEQRLAAVPGVSGVTAAVPLPLENVAQNLRWGTEEALADPNLFQQADFRIVQPGYFSVMGTRVVAGRAFDVADNDSAAKRIVVDDVFARKAFQGETAVGKRILARVGAEPEWFEIVGVVQQQRNATPAAESRETIYFTDGQFNFGAANRWIVRTTGDPASMSSAVRAAMREFDRTVAVADLRPLHALIDQARAPTRFALVCIGVFAVIAATLAGIGLYGVLSSGVRQRTSELGLRMAFGATTESILGLVLRQGATLALAGIAIGVVGAVALTRLMRTMLVGVSPTDPLTLAVIAVAFFGVAVVACLVPARRAARLDPLEALREE